MAICLGIYPIFRQTHTWWGQLGVSEDIWGICVLKSIWDFEKTEKGTLVAKQFFETFASLSSIRSRVLYWSSFFWLQGAVAHGFGPGTGLIGWLMFSDGWLGQSLVVPVMEKLTLVELWLLGLNMSNVWTCLNKHWSFQWCLAFGAWTKMGAWDLLLNRPSANHP